VSTDAEKQAAAQAAALLVEDGMRVGLGTGSTVAFLLPALAARGLTGLRCVATSTNTEQVARGLGLPVEPFEALDELDIAIDGADEVAPDGWLIKGGGGAHTREKLVAVTADRFVVIVSANKVVDRLTWPVPLELHTYGLASTLRRVPEAKIREGWPPSPDGGVIADFRGPIPDDPAQLAAQLAATPGIVDHGLFEPAITSDVLIARAEGVEHRIVR
jgi:ribose 5-phosphate isomerase A